jgi:hypothetical protein
MGIFSAILEKLRHHGSQAQASGGQQQQQWAGSSQQQPQASGQQAQPSGAQRGQPTQQQSQPFAQAGQQGSAQISMQNVDIDAVLSNLATQKGGGGNYRQSIVDLLKLLDLDSSLAARKELGQELNVHAGAHGSAEQNIALHKALMHKIEENGGKVPESMKH